METKVLEKGQVVIPPSLCRKLGIKFGDELHADVQNGNIVLSPKPKTKEKKSRKARMIQDAELGLPVLTAGEGAPTLTHERIRELLADFP